MYFIVYAAFVRIKLMMMMIANQKDIFAANAPKCFSGLMFAPIGQAVSALYGV